MLWKGDLLHRQLIEVIEQSFMHIYPSFLGELQKVSEAFRPEAILVRDDERRSEAGERRSKGYGFMAFKVAVPERGP